MVVCPKCDGKKKLLGFFPVYAEHVPQEERHPVIEMDCPTCKGEGGITPAHVQRIEAGKALRAKRKASGLGMREAGELIGGDICDVPYAEQGDLSMEEIARVSSQLDAVIAAQADGARGEAEIGKDPRTFFAGPNAAPYSGPPPVVLSDRKAVSDLVQRAMTPTPEAPAPDAIARLMAERDAMLAELKTIAEKHVGTTYPVPEGEPPLWVQNRGVIGDLEDEVRKLKADLAAAERTVAMLQSEREAQGWRDIATAPKDGTRILFCETGVHGIQVVSQGYWCEDEGWYETNTHPTDVTGGQCYPTHWMPLPAPPAARLSTEGE